MTDPAAPPPGHKKKPTNAQAALGLLGVLLLGLGVPVALYLSGAFDTPPPKPAAAPNVP